MKTRFLLLLLLPLCSAAPLGPADEDKKVDGKANHVGTTGHQDNHSAHDKAGIYDAVEDLRKRIDTIEDYLENNSNIRDGRDLNSNELDILNNIAPAIEILKSCGKDGHDDGTCNAVQIQNVSEDIDVAFKRMREGKTVGKPLREHFRRLKEEIDAAIEMAEEEIILDLEGMDGMQVAKFVDGTCYADDQHRFILEDRILYSATNSPDECIATCASRGYSYAGVQYAHECFCANQEPPASRIRDSSRCNMKCPGDSRYYCGGEWKMNVYAVKTGKENERQDGKDEDKKELSNYEKQLPFLFLNLDTNHDCELDDNDLISFFRDNTLKIPLNDAISLLSIEHEHARHTVAYEEWKELVKLAFEENSETKPLVHYWRDAFGKIEEDLEVGVMRPRDSIIWHLAETAIHTLAVTEKIGKCHPLELIDVENALVKIIDGVLEYRLTLRLSTMDGDNCEDEVVKVCNSIVVRKPRPRDCFGIDSLDFRNLDEIACTIEAPKRQEKVDPPQKQGSGPAGLQWVSDGDWEKMVGGKDKNPEVIVSSAERDTKWNKFCRTFTRGYWQTGWLNNPTKECYVARNQWWIKKKNFQRLVNPADSVEFEWIPWDSGKKDFPKGIVSSDPDSGWIAVRYHDGWTAGAQTDKTTGEIYYSGYGNWYWDNNEYDILTEIGITNYELLSIEFDNARPDLSKIPEKVFVDSQTIINSDPKHTTTQTAKLRKTVASTETWQHGITWSTEVGISATATVGDPSVASASSTFSFSIGISQNNNWGGSYTETHTFEQSATVDVPPNHKRIISLQSSIEEKDVPYKAQVRITYKNGMQKEVTDIGRIKAKLFGKSSIVVNEAIPLS